MKFLRSQSQTVLVVVLGVIGLGFLFYGNAGNLLTVAGSHVSNDYGRIDGEDLSQADLVAAVRNTRDSLIILQGRAKELNQPGMSAQIAEEAWRRLLLLHEADRLHIQVSDQEVLNAIHNDPVFQKDGVYSPEVYQSRMEELKNVLHGTGDLSGDATADAKAAFETLLRNELITRAVRRALFATVRIPEQDVSAQYEKFYGPVTVSLISFDPKSYMSKVQVTPEEIEAEYKANPDNPAYRTQEKRKVDYVLFPLSPEQAKLPEKEKAAAMDALGEKALDFALAFQPEPSAEAGNAPPPPDFLAEAKKRGLTPMTTDFFAVDTPPANMPPSPSFNNAAFSLTKDDPISKVVELDNGVAVLHLEAIQPSELRPLDEVKADIMKELQHAKAVQTAQVTANITAGALKKIVASGTDFKTAAASMELKVETLPAFVPFTTLEAQSSDPRLQTVADAAINLDPGQIAGPIPVKSDESILIAYLDSRAKADPSGLAEFETRYRESQDQQLRMMVYLDWVNWEDKQPGTHKPPDLDAYGSVE